MHEDMLIKDIQITARGILPRAVDPDAVCLLVDKLHDYALTEHLTELVTVEDLVKIVLVFEFDKFLHIMLHGGAEAHGGRVLGEALLQTSGLGERAEGVHVLQGNVSVF